jgi:hypothetical protein
MLGKAEIKSPHDLVFVLNGAKPGQTLTARIKRDGKVSSVPLTFDEHPLAEASAPSTRRIATSALLSPVVARSLLSCCSR